MKIKLAIWAIASVLGACSANAATLQFDSIDGVTDSSGNNVGPYSGRLDGTAYKLFCDDLDHNIRVGDTVTVNVSTISDLSKTRFGGVTGALGLYEQVFYLSSYLLTATNTDRANIQDAMWGYFASDAPSQSNSAVQGWRTLAANNYVGKDYSGYRILTDADSRMNGKQELFINTGSVRPGLVPEPGTWAMLLAGASAIGFGKLRKNWT